MTDIRLCACNHSPNWHMANGTVCVYPVDGKCCPCPGVNLVAR